MSGMKGVGVSLSGGGRLWIQVQTKDCTSESQSWSKVWEINPPGVLFPFRIKPNVKPPNLWPPKLAF